MWELTPVQRRIVSTRRGSSAALQSVSGPAEFIKLALEQLYVPYIYFKRGLSQNAGIGASFQVRFFDIDPENIESDTKRRLEATLKLKKGQWLVAKHIAPTTGEDLELKEAGRDYGRLASLVQELRVLAHEPLRSHPNIVKLLGFSWEKEKDEFDRRWPILFMESADCGSLRDFCELADASTKTPAFAAAVALDIACGLEALHGCGVIHGDLKPENILLFQLSPTTFRATVSDFGFAMLIKDLESETADEPVRVSLHGFSIPWEAPEASGEILLDELPKVDVYSFGLLVCYLASGGGDLFSAFRTTVNTEYDLDKIAALKTDPHGMVSYAKRLLLSQLHVSTEWDWVAGVVDSTLSMVPSDRKDMVEIRAVLGAPSKTERNMNTKPVPLLPADDASSDDHPQYQDFARLNRDLLYAASEDIVENWEARSISDINSIDPIRVEQGAQMLFWLSRALLSGRLGQISMTKAPELLLLSARAGSTEAKASVYSLFSALQEHFPADDLYDWLVDACYAGEELAERGLSELFPDRYPRVVQRLRTIYCGYGQDCFGERWRNEYPLDYLDDIVDDLVQDGVSINELHDFPGLVCGMTWLHYSASNGRLDMVRKLIDRGADPNIANDYGETPLFMACQGGHYEVTCFLCSMTVNPRKEGQGNFETNELHNLGRFDRDFIGEVATKLLSWGADINQKDGDRQQTPLARVLNQNGPNSIEAARVLLSLGADPLIKDYHGLDCLAHASCGLSPELTKLILCHIPEADHARCKSEALWFLLELDNYAILVEGGGSYADNLERILESLIDATSSNNFVESTGHPIFTFACGRSPLPVVKALAALGRYSSLDEWTSSAEEWYTPLMAAVVRNRVETVQYLVDLGADASLTNLPTRWTPLFYAATGSPQIVRALVHSVERTNSRDGAIQYVNRRDDSGATAFDIAVAGEFFEAADILASYQPELLAYTYPYEPGSTCWFNLLGLAAFKARQLFYLLDLVGPRVEPPMIDNKGVTILHAVCGVPIDRAPEDEAHSIVDSVLSRFPHSEYANRLTEDGEAALHFAARFGNINAIQKLDEMYGSNLDWHVVTRKGWSALDEAESRKFQDISELGFLARAKFHQRTRDTVVYLLGKGVGRHSDSHLELV